MSAAVMVAMLAVRGVAVDIFPREVVPARVQVMHNSCGALNLRYCDYCAVGKIYIGWSSCNASNSHDERLMRKSQPTRAQIGFLAVLFVATRIDLAALHYSASKNGFPVDVFITVDDVHCSIYQAASQHSLDLRLIGWSMPVPRKHLLTATRKRRTTRRTSPQKPK